MPLICNAKRRKNREGDWLTSWPLLVESRRRLLARGFIPKRRAEAALSTSRRVVRRTGTVPAGHDSPPSRHACGNTEAASSPPRPLTLGLSTGSSSGLRPRSLGWSNAGCRCAGTQWMTSPSGLCMHNRPNRTAVSAILGSTASSDSAERDKAGR